MKLRTNGSLGWNYVPWPMSGLGLDVDITTDADMGISSGGGGTQQSGSGSGGGGGGGSVPWNQILESGTSIATSIASAFGARRGEPPPGTYPVTTGGGGGSWVPVVIIGGLAIGAIALFAMRKK